MRTSLPVIVKSRPTASVEPSQRLNLINSDMRKNQWLLDGFLRPIFVAVERRVKFTVTKQVFSYSMHVEPHSLGLPIWKKGGGGAMPIGIHGNQR